MYIVYKATNIINNKVYIGATTTSLNQRMQEHLRHAKDINTDFAKDIIKYGGSNFDWEILQEADSKDELYKLEKYYIEKYNTFQSDKGYNMTNGGVKNYKLSNKSTAYLYGSKNPAAKKIIDLNTLKIYETIKYLSNDIGYSSQSIRKSILHNTPLNNHYYEYYDENKNYKKLNNNFKNKCRKPVRNITTGETFKTISQAAIKYNCERYGIRDCCNGKRDDFLGYKWEYII